MFERFTDRARESVVQAQGEARLLRHHYIGTEHLLLGILREGTGVGARVLDSLGIDLESVRGDVVRIVGEGMADGNEKDAEALRAIGIDWPRYAGGSRRPSGRERWTARSKVGEGGDVGTGARRFRMP